MILVMIQSLKTETITNNQLLNTLDFLSNFNTLKTLLSTSYILTQQQIC